MCSESIIRPGVTNLEAVSKKPLPSKEGVFFILA